MGTENGDLEKYMATFFLKSRLLEGCLDLANKIFLGDRPIRGPSEPERIFSESA